MPHEKLIRDKIPEITKRKGELLVTRIASKAELPELLRAKLLEEVREFLDATPETRAEELADILEVVYALGMLHHTPPSQLEILRAEKAQARGAFEAGVILISP